MVLALLLLLFIATTLLLRAATVHTTAVLYEYVADVLPHAPSAFYC